MDRIKVCHFTCAHEATDMRIFQKECVSLAKVGYEVYLVAPNATSEIKEGVHIIGVSVLSSNPFYRLFYSSRLVYKKALEINADLYHFHDIELFSYGMKLKKIGKKVIFDSHENWIGYIDGIVWLPLLVKKYMSWVIRRMYQKHLSELDAVITVSPHIVDILKQYSSKVYMVTNYPVVNVDNLNLLDEHTFMNRENKICYAGTVYQDSNQQSIINAIEQIENIEYLIVGILDDNLRKSLSLLSGWSKVRFKNKVPRIELKKIYNDVLAGIVIFDYSPNCGGRKGTMGNNKIFEYMLEGLPIICTDFDCWKDMIVEKYSCGYCVSPRDTAAIKKAIQSILDDRHHAFEMGQNARRAILDEFNWETQEKVLVDIYKNI